MTVEDTLAEVLTPIDGGFHVKDLEDGHCIDVLRMLYNWRIVMSDSGFDGTPHLGIIHAYCYFGFDQDDQGNPRTMETAFIRAVGAALAWDGTGDPANYDKKVF